MPGIAINVAVAIVRDTRGRVLINQRQVGKEHAGQWEFPGGKFEVDEGASAALRRECLEELGIEVSKDVPFMQFSYSYPTKKIRLHVRMVSQYLREPRALEGQVLEWVNVEQLKDYNLLPADKPILDALVNFESINTRSTKL